MRQPFDRLLLGRTLAGRYDIEEVIGAGGMSVVFRAMDRTLGRPVAVKVVSLPTDDDAMRLNLRERFRREAGSAARIPPHPNVVQVYDYGTDPELDLDFLVMELLRGHDLKEALARRPPSQGEALRILREAARGLAAGHRNGIVHRDVKPANVFLVGDGRIEAIRLLDFGIAKPVEQEDGDGLTTLGQLPHSPAYASPEQLDPDAPVGPPSDVFQLGLIGYELLAGERPFTEAGRARIQAGEDVAPADSPRWRAVPAPVREVLERALRRRPEERFPDAAAFAEALADAEDRTALHAAPPVVHEDATVAMPAAAPPPVVASPPPPRADPPPRVQPAPAPGVPVAAKPRTGRRASPVLWLAPLGLLLVAALFALTRRGGGGEDPDPGAIAAVPAPATAPSSDSTERARLDETFARMQGEAATAAAPADPGAGAGGAPAAVPPARPGEDTGPVAERNQDEAQAVQAAIIDVNQAWVEGDLDRHIAHYAERVDYYNANTATRDFVRADRARDLRKYDDDREMTVRRQAVTFPSPNRARALVDKEWRFEGSGERWAGAMRQELILEKRDGRWLIVAENQNEVYSSRKTPL